jgi:hypothetical protein
MGLDPAFRPARLVIKNPKRTKIKADFTLAVFDLFEQAYETVILLLVRYFGQTDESVAEVLALQQAVFFPMMTAVIRPLAEILTELPTRHKRSKDWSNSPRAGPSFEFARRLAFLPHREAAWRLIGMQLDGMTKALDRVRQLPQFPERIRARLSLIYENAARITVDFRQNMQLQAQP